MERCVGSDHLMVARGRKVNFLLNNVRVISSEPSSAHANASRGVAARVSAEVTRLKNKTTASTLNSAPQPRPAAPHPPAASPGVVTGGRAGQGCTPRRFIHVTTVRGSSGPVSSLANFKMAVDASSLAC